MAGAKYFRLAREGSWIVAGQIATVAGALALVRVLTEFLTPAEYGHLALGLTVAGLVNQTVMGGLIAAVGRFYSIAAEREDVAGYLLHSRRLIFCATGAVVVIGALMVGGLIVFDRSQWSGLVVAALALSVFSGYTAALASIQNAARNRAAAAIHGGLDAWLKIAFAVLAILWLGSSSTVVVVGYLVSSAVICGSQFVSLRASIAPGIRTKMNSGTDWSRKMWGYAWPFSIWGIFTWAQQVSDRWALQVHGSIDDVGFYAVAFQLGYAPIGLATGMLITFLGPILYRRSGDATDRDRNAAVHRLAWKMTWVSLAASFFGFVVTFFLHERIFELLVASRYLGASSLLPGMVLAGGIFAAGQMLALKMMSELKSGAMTTAKIATAILGVLLNFYGAATLGAEGVVAALCISSGAYFLWMAWLARRPPSLSTGDLGSI